MRKAICMALVLIFMLGLAAAQAAAAPKVLTYANGNEPPVLDPVMNNYAKTSILIYNIYCGLSRIGANGIAELAYAESYDVSDDGMIHTFRIRKDSKFSDGSPLTAHDWEKGFKYHMAPETAAPNITLKRYVKNSYAYKMGECSADEVGIKALDDYTLQIELESPAPYFLDLACTYLPYKMEVILADPNWMKKPETYIGNGAFRIKELNPQQSVILEKNPYYYDADNVHIDQVNFMFIDDPAVQLEAYKNGEIDVSDGNYSEAIATFNGTEEYFSMDRIGCKFYDIDNSRFSDVRVRRALALALDREIIIKDILGLTYRPATGLVPWGIIWGGTDKQYRDVAGPLFGTDIPLAKKLMAEAGYPDGEGFPTLRFVTQNNQEDIDTAQAMQAMWKDNLGVNSDIITYESSVYWDVLRTDNWDIFRDGWTGDYNDPSTNLFLWRIEDDSTAEQVHWNDEYAVEYDRVLNLAYAELDLQKRMEYFLECEKILVDQFPIIPMFFYDNSILIKPYVKGLVKSYIGHVFFGFADIVK